MDEKLLIEETTVLCKLSTAVSYDEYMTYFSDCSGGEHKKGSLHHLSLSQYSCNILPGDACATSLWVFME